MTERESRITADPSPTTDSARAVRWPWIVLALGTLLATLFAAGAAWFVRSADGVALAVRAIDALLPERITATGIRGAFATTIEIDELRIEVDGTVVALTGVRGSIDTFAPLARRLALTELSADRVAVRLPALPSQAPASVPKRIAAPLTFDAHTLRIGEFVIERERPIFGIRAIDAALAFGPQGTQVRRFAAEVAGNRLTVVGTLGPTRPFPIDAGGTLVSRLVVGGGGAAPATLDTPVQATWRALDSLEHLELHAGVTGGPASAARGALHARVAPFAADALQSIDADVAGIDPAAWFAGAPHAELELRAELRPVAADTFTLAGPVHLFNRRVGAWDSGRIPVRELRGRLTAHAGALALDEARALLVRGTAAGRFAIDWSQPAAPHWDVDARLDGIDPSTIHTRAQPMAVDGRLAAQSEPPGTRVQAQLRARAAPGRPPFSLDADLRIDADRIALDQARLRLDGGYAQLAGELAQRDARAFSVSGTLRELNPGLLVKGADARLNGELRAEGVLRPAPRATLRARLVDSVAFGRPLRGQVDARWLGADEVEIDADLAVRSAALTVRGGLGSDAGGIVRNLEVTLNAPAMEELGLPLRGAIEARAVLSGALSAPSIDARAQASGIVYAGQRIGRLDAQLRYGGGADGALHATAALRAHRHPRGTRLSLAEAQIQAAGTLREHRITLTARTADGDPLAAELAGGWRSEAPDLGESGAWLGRFESASAGGAFDAALTAPAELAVGVAGLRIGPAQLRAHGARVIDARLQWRNEPGAPVLESSGAFEDFVLAATAGAGETPLALRGEWNVRSARSLGGRVLIERTRGDVHTGSATRRAKMGLAELRVEALLDANRLQARAIARGSEVGAVTAALRADLESDSDGWRLAPQREWSGELEASVPSLAWINPFLSANLRESIRVGGSLQASVRLAGTPAAPRASGFVNADGLRVAWIEQGVRLDNGVVRARLAADERGATEIVFDSASFSGRPRFVPDDRRVRQALGAQASGRLEASGRVKLPELEGVVQMQFVRFPLVERRDRWAVGTGGANLVFSPKRVRLDGALVADAGYIDIARPTVPALSDDVVVVRAADGPRRPAEPRVAFDFDFGIDLGPAFILLGSGVDTRLAGALRVRHEGRGVIRATGTVEARDGTYEGYGQKLVIERGRINFQGPIDNPGLDILALRKGLPVEVGVTITRTAANPLVRLYSDPPQPDFETLSWLVLGRPAEASRGDNVALARAAVGLLGGAGEGVPTQLARRLGIDEFSIRTADVAGSGSLLPRQSVAGRVRGDTATLGGEIVTIGKRLSDALTLSYEQATTGTTNVVQLSYRLTQRLSVIARAGTENALDLVYSFAFD
ncbi:MAG: hypothetical protein OHK0044_00470 [Burkholderiaceae bacterium]